MRNCRSGTPSAASRSRRPSRDSPTSDAYAASRDSVSRCFPAFRSGWRSSKVGMVLIRPLLGALVSVDPGERWTLSNHLLKRAGVRLDARKVTDNAHGIRYPGYRCRPSFWHGIATHVVYFFTSSSAPTLLSLPAGVLALASGVLASAAGVLAAFFTSPGLRATMSVGMPRSVAIAN